MKRSKFSEEQIAYALRQTDSGTPVGDVCRRFGVSEATFYVWKKKYGKLGLSEPREIRQLRNENARLKRLVADLSLDKAMLQDVVRRKCMVRPGFARSSLNGENSLRKCIRPLASEERLLPGHDEMRACGSYQTWYGLKARFRRQAYRMPIDCFVIFLRTSQTQVMVG